MTTTSRTTNLFSPKQISRFFFSPALDEQDEPTGYQICKACGEYRKHIPRTGYTNLVSHVRNAHPNYEAEMRDASAAATGTLVPWTRRFAQLPPVSVDTLYSNMESVTKAVEKAIAEEMLERFGLILDGWSHGTENFLATFACYQVNGSPRYPLLSMAPAMASDAEIVHSPEFESAVVKALSGKSGGLTVAQRAVLRSFLRAATATEKTTELDVPSLAKRKVEAALNRYVMLEAISPTSNVIQRLFSSARSVLRHIVAAKAKSKDKATPRKEACKATTEAASNPTTAAATQGGSLRRSRSRSLSPDDRPNPRFAYRDHSPGAESPVFDIPMITGSESDEDTTGSTKDPTPAQDAPSQDAPVDDSKSSEAKAASTSSPTKNLT
ncbi:Hypothetical protein PHPALM_9801 [Phytophthora palmivora]|uniref:BED-type domain-containing protein n=1 Tax=Phytophthora palmivora TaxID=4796 RepID=A0A2P4Y6C5_9STRA|nr:Hypothetical protein PHPALM_9801 [Phytophthora palmivora]